MKLINTAAQLYNRAFNRIDVRPGKMGLVKAFETKRYHTRISEMSESKLLTIFNAALLEASPSTDEADRLKRTSVELNQARDSVNKMEPTDARTKLSRMLDFMSEHVDAAAFRLKSTRCTFPPASNRRTVTARSEASRFNPEQTTLTGVVLSCLKSSHPHPNLASLINAFMDHRFGLSLDLSITTDVREWSRLRNYTGCHGLWTAASEVNVALAEITRWRRSPAYPDMCEALSGLHKRIERLTDAWLGQFHRALQEGPCTYDARLIASVLGEDHPEVQQVRLLKPGLIAPDSSDDDFSDAGSSTWSDDSTSLVSRTAWVHHGALNTDR